MNAIKFSVVYVSPMYRTLMTAMNVFKTHPDRQKITFVVLPVAKEALNLCNDTIGPFTRIYEAFKDPEKCEGIFFDFSLCHSYGRESTW